MASQRIECMYGSSWGCELQSGEEGEEREERERQGQSQRMVLEDYIRGPRNIRMVSVDRVGR
jgi:hypothetical protein